jgi:Bacterial regulatory proteins, gntR family
MRLIQRAETIKEPANGLWTNKHTGGEDRSAMTGDVTREFVNVSVERMFTAAKLVDEVRPAGLAEMFKVSRFPIREALFALENEGAVTTEPYRGQS